jgi:hypothetical protein
MCLAEQLDIEHPDSGTDSEKDHIKEPDEGLQVRKRIV